MKKYFLFTFIALFAFVNFACTEVGKNNKIANGDLEIVEESFGNEESTNVRKPELKNSNISEKKTPTLDLDSPEAVVEDLYNENEKENSPFFQNTDRPLIDKFFTKGLADMIWKDAVSVTDEELGVLDFDPLYNAQDAEVANLKVGKAEISNDKATLNVTFLNFGEEQSVKYLLTKENNEWKIEDIDYTKETLKKIYKQSKAIGNETVEQ